MAMVMLGEWLDSIILELSPSPDNSVIYYILINTSTSKEKASGKEYFVKQIPGSQTVYNSPLEYALFHTLLRDQPCRDFFAPTPSSRAKLGVCVAKMGFSLINGV